MDSSWFFWGNLKDWDNSEELWTFSDPFWEVGENFGSAMSKKSSFFFPFSRLFSQTTTVPSSIWLPYWALTVLIMVWGVEISSVGLVFIWVGHIWVNSSLELKEISCEYPDFGLEFEWRLFRMLNNSKSELVLDSESLLSSAVFCLFFLLAF